MYRINRRYGSLEVDLFTSRLTNQCQCYYNWRPDPFAEAVNAFLQNWSEVKGFANPPWSIPQVLNHTGALIPGSHPLRGTLASNSNTCNF